MITRALALAVFLTAPAAFAQQYEIVDLGVPDSEAFALNERSDVVGIQDPTGSGQKRSFLWTEHPQFGLPAGASELGTLGGTYTDAHGLNVLGQATGGSYTAANPFSQQAYLWLPAGAYGLPAGMNALGSLGGAQIASRGNAINDLAQIAGVSFSGDPQDFTAFVWLPQADHGLSAGMHGLDTLGGLASWGEAINGHAEVAGRSTLANGNAHAFLWLPTAKYGLPAGMNDLAGGSPDLSEAWGINDRGEVVGDYLTSTFDIRAFLWLPAPAHGLPRGFNDLGLLASDPSIAALDVNTHGAVVGFGIGPMGEQTAALWERGVWRDLNLLVAPGSGWTLEVANAINDAGNVVGRGTFNGAWRAFLLRRVATPPLATYCTAKTTSNGCTPVVDGHGAPSVANGAGFLVACIGLRNQTPARFFYGSSGRQSTPFAGGTLCVAGPLGRAPSGATGGTAAPADDCSGVLQLDFNAFAAGLLGGSPSAALSTPGTTIDVQAWGRDPGFAPPDDAQLSDALEYVVAP